MNTRNNTSAVSVPSKNQVTAADTRQRLQTLLRKQLAELVTQAAPTRLVWTPDGCAKKLFVSSRTLHRHLLTAGTTFHDETNRARVEAAEKLLTETTVSMQDVALRVGLSGGARLSQLMRQYRQRTPREVRQQVASGSADDDERRSDKSSWKTQSHDSFSAIDGRSAP